MEHTRGIIDQYLGYRSPQAKNDRLNIYVSDEGKYNQTLQLQKSQQLFHEAHREKVKQSLKKSLPSPDKGTKQQLSLMSSHLYATKRVFLNLGQKQEKIRLLQKLNQRYQPMRKTTQQKTTIIDRLDVHESYFEQTQRQPYHTRPDHDTPQYAVHRPKPTRSQQSQESRDESVQSYQFNPQLRKPQEEVEPSKPIRYEDVQSTPDQSTKKFDSQHTFGKKNDSEITVANIQQEKVSQDDFGFASNTTGTSHPVQSQSLSIPASQPNSTRFEGDFQPNKSPPKINVVRYDSRKHDREKSQPTSPKPVMQPYMQRSIDPDIETISLEPSIKIEEVKQPPVDERPMKTVMNSLTPPQNKSIDRMAPSKPSEDMFLEELDELEDIPQPRTTPKNRDEGVKQLQEVKKEEPKPVEPPKKQEAIKQQEPVNQQDPPKQPSIVFKSYVLRYQRYLKQINIIGEMVANALELLEANKNVWIIPLFLVFKRMFQIRLRVEKELGSELNPWKFNNFETAFKKSAEFTDFKQRLSEENGTVGKEVQEIMAVALKRMAKLDQNGAQKMVPLINMNMDMEIRDPVFVYLYSQIYSRVKQSLKQAKAGNSGKPEKYTEKQWLILSIRIQASLIILELPPYDDSQTLFNPETYELVLHEANMGNMVSYSEGQVSIVNDLRKRLQNNGYSV